MFTPHSSALTRLHALGGVPTIRRAGQAGAMPMVAIFMSSLASLPLFAQETSPTLDLQPDIPEEILQTEVILQGRSPLNGEVLSPSEYAQLQDQLQVARREVPAKVPPEIQRLIVLLRLRKVVITLFPFLN